VSDYITGETLDTVFQAIFGADLWVTRSYTVT